MAEDLIRPLGDSLSGGPGDSLANGEESSARIVDVRIIWKH